MKGFPLSQIVSLTCAALIVLVIGALTAAYNVFPGKQIEQVAQRSVRAVNVLSRVPGFMNIDGTGPRFQIHDPARVEPGLTMIARNDGARNNLIEVVDLEGNLVHSWSVDLFEIWPEGGWDWVPPNVVPKARPGASVHGLQVTPDGGIIFNFEYISTIRVDACSNIVWKRKNMGHHSVTRDTDEDYWIAGHIFHRRQGDLAIPNLRFPFGEDLLVEISPEGEVKRSFSVVDILYRNDLPGLIYMKTGHNTDTRVKGDLTHINDVEVFPPHLEEGIFRHGDIAVSIRNMNTVIVIDPQTLKIKHRATGMMLRQHDIDFVSGDSYLIFDNRNMRYDGVEGASRSRILEITASEDGGVRGYREVYRGEGNGAFFTTVMGAQQPLPGGNALAIVSREGRVLELTPEGDVVWEFRNAISDTKRALVTEAERLPPEIDAAFFAEKRAACEG